MENIERKKIVIGLYNKGMSYSQIGKIFNISRQRVHQIITGYSSNCIAVNLKSYKEDILKRDRRRCVLCGHKSNLIIHHIDSDRTNNVHTNLILLCRSCHTKIHNEEQFGIEFKKKKR